MQTRTCLQALKYKVIIFTIVFLVTVAGVMAGQCQEADAQLSTPVFMLSSYCPDFSFFTSLIAKVRLFWAADALTDYEILRESLTLLNNRADYQTLHIWPIQWLFIGVSGLFLLEVALVFFLLRNFLRKKAAEEATRVKQRMEVEMARKERWNQMGEMAAGIIHEIKQPLTSLRFVTEAALYWYGENQPPSRESMVQNLELIREQIDKIESIMENVRSIIKLGQLSGEWHPVDLNQVIVKTLESIKGELQDNCIMLDLRLEKDLPPVRGTVVQLEEIILNLLRNALLALQSVPKSNRRITLTTYWQKYVILEVADNGPGVPEEIADNIFKAFYTTRGDKGLGIGLTFAKKVSELFRGSLELVPSARGATFQLKLHTYHEEERYYADFTCR